MVNILPALRGILSWESDWHTAFVKAIANEKSRDSAESDIRHMDSKLEVAEQKVDLLKEENNPDRFSRISIASDIHSRLAEILNDFNHRNSLLRKYALLAAPPFIALSSMVATFTPLALSLIPAEMKKIPLACNALDNLLDYRPRAVSDRLDKIHSEHFRYTEAKTRVLLLPYNENGYNKSNILACNKGCRETPYYVQSTCMTDDFSTDKIEAKPQRTRRIKPEIEDACWEGYNSYVREKVEQLFPVAMLALQCVDRKQQTKTGKTETNSFHLRILYFMFK